MTERTWSIWAYRKDDEQLEARRVGVPEWRLAQAVNWAVFRGFDTVLIELSIDPPSSTRTLTHHICADPKCPGGC